MLKRFSMISNRKEKMMMFVFHRHCRSFASSKDDVLDLKVARQISDDDPLSKCQIREPKPETNRPRRMFTGTIVHSLSCGHLECLSPGIMAVDASGKILFCEEIESRTGRREDAEKEAAKHLANLSDTPSDHDDAYVTDLDAVPPLSNDTRFAERGGRAHFTINDFEWIDLGPRLMIPGFVDAHVHAPQYGFIGLGVGLPLLQWLDKYTFPFESRFSDLGFATEMYSAAVARHLRHGTTFSSYFATIHVEATKELTRIAREMGQRVYVGKVNMDRNGAPKVNYIESTKESIEGTEEFVQHVNDMNDPLAVPVVTPRFVPTCTSDLMHNLADISDRETIPVQTHMNENKGEIAWVKELHPECDSYADVYDSHGLMHERTYVAHCIHCSNGEIDLMAHKGSSVVHCPNSNFALRSGVCDVRQLLNRGVKVALGTDVGGGTHPSILDAIRLTLCASVAACQMNEESSEDKVERCGQDLERAESFATSKKRLGEDLKDAFEKGAKDPKEPLSMAEAFHLATQGGAEVLGQGDVVGNFLPGKSLDALIINPEGVHGAAGHGRSPFDVTENESPMEVFQKFIFLGDDRNIEQVFVDGRRVL